MEIEMAIFKKYDKIRKYAYYNDRLELAKKLGYEFISEATVKLYKKHKSIRHVGRILNISGVSVGQEIKSIQKKYGIVKIGPRGGNHKGGNK